MEGNSSWASGVDATSGGDATRFGYFGKVSVTDDNGIESVSVGCRSDSDVSNPNSLRSLRGGLDDFAIFNGVLSESEIKVRAGEA
jgi:hypothetical protein